jgi:hypothetical protein
VQPPPIIESVLTCPNCGFAAMEMIPTNACVVVHDCAGCHAQLRPKHGHCCVFCSYGSVKCPPMQQAIRYCGVGVSRFLSGLLFLQIEHLPTRRCVAHAFG